MADLRRITHCIFDVDGLILDTETFYTIVQQNIVSKYGKTFTWDLKAKMMGKKALEAAQVLIDELQVQGELSAEDFIAMREEELDRMFPTAQLMPGADRLIRHLRASGVPIAVATSSHARHFAMKSQNHTALFALFNHIVTGDQVQRGKPAPDIFHAAASKFSPAPAPEQCLVFEDAPSGVEAAVNAGMPVVMVPDPNLDPALCSKASKVLSSLEEFDPAAWGLPPFPA